MTEHTYEYRVMGLYDESWGNTKYDPVIDGDTFDLVVDMGFFDYSAKRIRLKDIDTFEVYGKHASPLGQEAREFARSWLTDPERELRVQTFADPERDRPVPDGSFGRWIGDVYDLHTGDRLNQALREAGYEDTG